MDPAAVAVKVVRAGVVSVCVSPAPGVRNVVVALAVPIVPLITPGRLHDLVLGVVRALDLNEVSLFNGRVALRCRDFSLAIADGHFRFRRRVDLDSIMPFAQWVNGYIRGVNFHLGFRSLEDGETNCPLRHLDLNVSAGKIRELRLGALVNPQDVRAVEFNFSSGARAG